MSCKEYQRLLHLNRSGEVSRREQEDLQRHLRSCEKCALERQRIARAEGFIGRLRAFSPTPESPERLTADILRRVRAASAVSQPFKTLDRVLDFFLLPSVRYSAVTVVLLITVGFITQFFLLARDISGLENRMASTAQTQDIEATYSVQSKTLQQIAESEKGRSIRENVPLTVTDGHIDVPVKTVDSFLSEYGLKNLPTILEPATLGLDRKTLEKIANELKATAERTFRFRHEGA